MSQQDFYEILGVSREADADSIKKAYRQLAMKYHPDKNPGDKAAEERFKEAATAYEILSNPQKRAQYDRFGHAGMSGMGNGGFQDINDIFSSFSDIFNDFFGGAPRGQRSQGGSSRARRGSDLRYVLEISLEEVCKGAEKEVSFPVEQSCAECNGSGSEKGSGPTVCPTCQGFGQVVRSQGFFSLSTPCSQCQGTGQIIKNPCVKCRGRGRVERRKKIQVSVPAGVDTGTRLRMSQEGEAGFNGGPPGDLYIEIQVHEHPQFHREGSNLMSRLKISYIQAILGTDIEVDIFGEKVVVAVPPGIQPQERLRVTEKGVPGLRGGKRGDVYYEVEVEIPKKLKKEEDKLIRQLADLRGDKVSDSSGFFRRLY